jgi:hypothetical protein
MDYSFPGILQMAGQAGMEGYVPATAQNNMQGYGNYMNQLTNNNGQGGQGAGYQFNDPSFEAYQAEQMKAEQDEQERQATIANIKSQISELEQRIASNTSKLKEMLTGNAVADEIASLEGDKFGFRFNRQVNNDPTSLFRWAQGRKDTQNQMAQSMAANKANDERAIKNFANTVSMYQDMRLSEDTGSLEQQLNNVNGAIRDGKNLGADVSGLIEVKNKIENKLNGTGEFKGTDKEQRQAATKDFLNSKPNSASIKSYLEENGDKLTNDDKINLKMAYHEAVRKEKAKAEAKAFQDFRTNYMKQNGLTESDMEYFEDEVKKAFKNRGR